MPNPRPYDFQRERIFEGYDPASDSDTAPTPSPSPPGNRYQIIPLSSNVFAVSDTLTNTIREITSNKNDAKLIKARLDLGLTYAGGRRWPMPAKA